MAVTNGRATTTVLASNVLGQRTQVIDPRGLVTTYTLDTRGLLTAKSSPDAGTINHQYDAAGNRRYTQDANRAAAGQVEPQIAQMHADTTANLRAPGTGTAPSTAGSQQGRHPKANSSVRLGRSI